MTDGMGIALCSTHTPVSSPLRRLLHGHPGLKNVVPHAAPFQLVYCIWHLHKLAALRCFLNRAFRLELLMPWPLKLRGSLLVEGRST